MSHVLGGLSGPGEAQYIDVSIFIKFPKINSKLKFDRLFINNRKTAELWDLGKIHFLTAV
jgi:hypothetical protein